MAKSPSEKLGEALRANLRRRKGPGSAPAAEKLPAPAPETPLVSPAGKTLPD